MTIYYVLHAAVSKTHFTGFIVCLVKTERKSYKEKEENKTKENGLQRIFESTFYHPFAARNDITLHQR